MSFRRPSEGRAHAVLRCIGLVIVNLGLFAFAVYNIVLLFRYEFFLQSSENLVTEADPLVEFPDILVCSSIYFVNEPTLAWYSREDPLKRMAGPNVTLLTYNLKDISRKHPCTVRHDLFAVLTLNGEKVNRTLYQHLYVALSPNLFEQQVEAMAPAFVVTLPHQNNPYLRDQSTWPPLFHESRDIVENLYAITNTNQQARVRTTITKTWHRREDFVGLWGYFQDQPTYSAATQFASYYTNSTNNATRINFHVPVTSFEQSQVLIQTFQSAFSSWGGAFGVAWGFFYFLFGAPRMDPFGFFALYILGKSTKRIIANRYFAEKKDSSIINNHQYHSSSNSGSDPSTKVSQRGHGSTSALSQDYNNGSDDLEAQQKKELRYRDLEARIVSLEAVLDDFYLDLSPFRKEKEEEQQQSRSWISRTFSSKTKDENDGAFVQMEDKGVKTSYESESYRMGQMQRDRTE